MEIKPVYLFYGEEDYLIQRDLAIFRDYFGQKDCTVEEFDGLKTALENILDVARTCPLFGQSRLLIVKNSPWFCATKKQGQGREDKSEETEQKDNLQEERELLLDYLSAPGDGTCVVFVAERVAKTLKVVKVIGEMGKMREYKKPRSWELPGLLGQYLRKQQKTVSPRALELLIAMVGEELGSLMSECDKLLLYTTERREITEADIFRVASNSAEANIFHLSDALGSRDVVQVKELSYRLMAELKPWEYAKVFAYTTNYIRLLMRIKEYQAKGYREEQIAAATKINSYRIKLGIPAAKQYRMGELQQALKRLMVVEYQMKSGHTPFKENFPVALMAIASGVLR